MYIYTSVTLIQRESDRGKERILSAKQGDVKAINCEYKSRRSTKTVKAEQKEKEQSNDDSLTFHKSN